MRLMCVIGNRLNRQGWIIAMHRDQERVKACSDEHIVVGMVLGDNSNKFGLLKCRKLWQFFIPCEHSAAADSFGVPKLPLKHGAIIDGAVHSVLHNDVVQRI